MRWCPSCWTTLPNAWAVAEGTSPTLSQAGRGIALMLLANLLFSFVDTSTKWMLGAGLVAVQLAFMRYAVHFALTMIERGWRMRSPAMEGRIRMLVLARAFCLVSATLVNFVAIGQLPLSVTSAILFFSPVFVCLFAHPILGEVVTGRHWQGVAIGFAGVFVILWPFGAVINWYAVLMIYPAASMAMYQVLTRKLSGQVRPSVLQFYTGALGTAVLLPFALIVWVTPPTGLAWTLLFAIGAFAWAGHEALTRAHAYAGASSLAPAGYSFVVYLTAAGWIVFGEVPTVNVAVGALMIFAAGVLLWRRV